jgi:hypothetical protein
MKNIIQIFFALSMGINFVLTGCTTLETFPQAARSGDTVALAVGSPDGMNRDNTTAVFVSDASPASPVDLTSNIRGIFRLYADKLSDIYNPGTNVQEIFNTSGHEPWVTILVLDLPSGLPVGPGEVKVSTTASYPTIGSHINDFPVQLEIIPGTGAPSDFAYEFGKGGSRLGNLALLEPVPHAQIIPVFPPSGTWPSYGAMEIKLNVPTTAGSALESPVIRVIPDDLNSFTGSQVSMTYHHDDNQVLTVLLVSPVGALRTQEARFSVVLMTSQYMPLQFSSTPAITSVRYYDIDGSETSGPDISDYLVELR